MPRVRKYVGQVAPPPKKKKKKKSSGNCKFDEWLMKVTFPLPCFSCGFVKTNEICLAYRECFHCIYFFSMKKMGNAVWNIGNVNMPWIKLILFMTRQKCNVNFAYTYPYVFILSILVIILVPLHLWDDLLMETVPLPWNLHKVRLYYFTRNVQTFRVINCKVIWGKRRSTSPQSKCLLLPNPPLPCVYVCVCVLAKVVNRGHPWVLLQATWHTFHTGHMPVCSKWLKQCKMSYM